MAFLPNSTIYLCNVPFDSTQKNQIYFTTKSQQKEYFSSKSVDMLLSYLVIRKTLENGSLQSSVKVDKNIDDLQTKGVNYIFYQNANHGEKYFYCFVDKLIYINEGTTEIVFHTDVYQTWLFDVNILPSFVVREHTVSDVIGEHIVPENFNFKDFNYMELLNTQEINDNTQLNDYCYLLCSTESWQGGEDELASKNICDVAQGFTFGVALNTGDIISMTNKMSDKDEGWLQSIVAIPKFSLLRSRIANLNDASKVKLPDDNEVISGEVLGGSEISETEINIYFAKNNVKFNGYTPKNNKLYTAPYFTLAITNHNGVEKEYALENFSGLAHNEVKDITFKLMGEISTNPSVYVIPCNFLGVGTNYDYATVLSEMPQISHNSDTYKLWLARNQGTIALETMGNLLNVVTGVATIGSGVGGFQAVSGVQGILSTINNVNQASRMPNKVTGGGGKNYLLLAKKKNKFEYYWKTLKKDHAETVDNFFTMYGYQINKVKQPNIDTRPYFNYIQTIDINIRGGIPCDDMTELKSIYNNGVTLWKPTAVIGNYDVDNSPQ